MCDPSKDYALKYTVNLKTEGDKQTVEEAVYTASFDLDDKVEVNMTVF